MLSDDLRHAFHKTDYHVFAQPPFVLHSSALCQEADALLRELGHTVGIVLTAWNPMSVETDAAANAAAQARLLEELERFGLATLPAEGRGRDTTWPPEPSVFIPGITSKAAHALAVKFRQAAWVEVAVGQPVRIVETDFGDADI